MCLAFSELLLCLVSHLGIADLTVVDFVLQTLRILPRDCQQTGDLHSLAQNRYDSGAESRRAKGNLKMKLSQDRLCLLFPPEIGQSGGIGCNEL